MYNFVRNLTPACETCQKTKCDNRPPKLYCLKCLFQTNLCNSFIDIAYLPKDNSGYTYILLIGDIFSKFITTVPLKDQTVPVIASALLNNWIYVHGILLYLLSDQESYADGHVMNEICTTLGIEKRRSSAYHSQGNGFAERNIRTVKDMLRSVLLHCRLPRRNGETFCIDSLLL